jgi:hypothetical protein
MADSTRSTGKMNELEKYIKKITGTKEDKRSRLINDGKGRSSKDEEPELRERR